MASRKATVVKADRKVKTTSAARSEDKERDKVDKMYEAYKEMCRDCGEKEDNDPSGELRRQRELAQEQYFEALTKYHMKKDKKLKIEKNEPIDIYIGEYWFDGVCIKTYQKDPVVADIEVIVSDHIQAYNNGLDDTYELLKELKAARAGLDMGSTIFIAGADLNADEICVPGAKHAIGFEKSCKEEDLQDEEEECGVFLKLWFGHIRALLHAGKLKNDFDHGVGYRLTNATLRPNDPLFRNLMVNK